MIVSTEKFPLRTGYIEAAARPISTINWDSGFAAVLADLSPEQIRNLPTHPILPNMPQGDVVVSAPFAIKCISGHLVGAKLHASHLEQVELLKVDDADKPALLPSDAIVPGQSTWVSEVPANPAYIGVGISAFPVFDDGHVCAAMNFVPRASSIAGFPDYERGLCAGWYESAPEGSVLAARYPGLFLDAYSDLGFSEFGINTAYNSGGVIDVGGFVSLANHVVFGFDPSWDIVRKTKFTNFSASVNPAAISRAEELSERKIIGLSWYGHGYWTPSTDPYFVNLGTTTDAEFNTLTADKVLVGSSVLRRDFSSLFRTYRVRNAILPTTALLRELLVGETSETILLRTKAGFSTGRGAYLSYMEV